MSALLMITREYHRKTKSVDAMCYHCEWVTPAEPLTEEQAKEMERERSRAYRMRPEVKQARREWSRMKYATDQGFKKRRLAPQYKAVNEISDEYVRRQLAHGMKNRKAFMVELRKPENKDLIEAYRARLILKRTAKQLKQSTNETRP